MCKCNKCDQQGTENCIRLMEAHTGQKYGNNAYCRNRNT